MCLEECQECHCTFVGFLFNIPARFLLLIVSLFSAHCRNYPGVSLNGFDLKNQALKCLTHLLVMRKVMYHGPSTSALESDIVLFKVL